MITNIKLKNVRKFDEINLAINSNNVILQGGNATGKTTILESISLVSITKSHRTNNPKEIIKEAMMYADIKVTYDTNIHRIVVSNQGKMVSVNNLEQSKLSEYFQLSFFHQMI